MWSITVSIDLDTKCANKRNYLLGTVVCHIIPLLEYVDLKDVVVLSR